MAKVDPAAIEAAILKVTKPEPELTEQERAAVRAMLEWYRVWQAWGRLGRLILWIILTTGAIAAALREMMAWAR